MANIGLILAVSAMIRPMAVSGRVVTREVPIMLLITGLIYPVLMDFHVSRMEGFGLLGLIVAYLVFVLRVVRHEDDKILAFRRGDLLFLINFHPRESFADYPIFAAAGEYERVLCSDDAEFGGHARVESGHGYFTENTPDGDRLLVYLPSRVALVLRQK